MNNIYLPHATWIGGGRAAVINTDSLPEATPAARRPSHSDRDMVGHYLAHLVDSPVLTRAAENRLGMQVQAAHRNYRLSLLGCREVLVGVIRLLKRIHQGELRLDRYVDLAVSDIAQKNRIRKLLEPTIAELQAIERGLHRDFVICLSKSAPKMQRACAWKRVVWLRRRAARLAEDIKLRTAVLSKFLPQVRASSRRMSWLRALKHSSGANLPPEFQAQVKAELNRLMLQCLDSPATLERRIRQMEVHYCQFTYFRKKLACGNLRFVVSIAKQFRGNEVPFTDLIQEGNVGLLRAVERFDPGKGFRFTTYAEWWIRQAIQSAVAQASGPLGVPHNFKAMIRRIRLSSDRLSQAYGREPRVEEVAHEVGLSTQRVLLLMRLSQRARSLSQSISDGNDGQFVDFVEDRAESAIIPDDVGERLNEIMKVLDPREQQILRMRFGLGDGIERTLTEIGRRYQLSRERIRQIENRAVKKLRQPSCMKALADLLP